MRLTGWVIDSGRPIATQRTMPSRVPCVSRYHLSPNNRYVYTNGYIYQVDPTTYAVQRVIDAITR